MISYTLVFIFINLVGLPCSIIALVTAAKMRTNFAKVFIIILTIITFALHIATTVLLSIYRGFTNNTMYTLGTTGYILGVSCILLGVFDLLLSLDFRNMDLNRSISNGTPIKESEPKVEKEYIAELKALKELLNSGVLTQKEFDLKKKEILERK